MKKLQLNIPAMAARLCAAGLAMLGLSACESQKAMYGSPVSSFEIKGMVETESGESVSDASVIIRKASDSGFAYQSDTIKTDADGLYNYYGLEAKTVRVVCKPKENSGLEADSTDVYLDYRGKEAKAIADFRLRKK